MLQPPDMQSQERSGAGRELVAWHGVGAVAPADWNIVATSGNVREGYLRADGPEGRSLELRWKRARRHPDLDLVAKQYLKQVEKTGRRQKIDYSTDLDLEEKGRKKKLTDVRFRWKSERQGFGRLIWCPECRRTVIAQVSAPADADIERVAERVLSTVRDHAADPQMIQWGVYGLAFAVPRAMKLLRYRLMSGFLSMNFVRGKSERVIVERWGLAETVLEDGGMHKWHEREYLSELKHFRGSVEAVDLGEHEALETVGYEGGLRRLRSLLKAFLIPGRAERYASLVWHCPQANRIIGVRAFGRRPLELARAVAASVRCHSV